MCVYMYVHAQCAHIWLREQVGIGAHLLLHYIL